MPDRPLIALVDGEHHPPAVRDALDALGRDRDVANVIFCGGEEKLTAEVLADPERHYGVSVTVGEEPAQALRRLAQQTDAGAVVDLADEPILPPAAKLRLAALALHLGLAYEAPGLSLAPPEYERIEFAGPKLAVIGTGKRTGKTAVAGHLATLLRDRGDAPVIVSMGRGGPPEPQVAPANTTVEDLEGISAGGHHAASDYLEDATLAHVPTVGCRRCGGGLAGMPFVSNVEEAGRVAAARSPDLVVLEGSGASIPPLEAARRILVASAAQGAESVAGYLGAYRLLVSDLVVLTMCEEPLATSADVERVGEAIADVDPDLPVLPTVFRPRPVSPISGRRVVLFSTAPAAAHATLREHLEEEHGAEVLLVSGNLGRRPELASDLETAEAHSADLYLVEIKAAAIDVVAETAAERGVEVVFADNAVVPLAGGDALDDHVRALADAVTKVPA